jgi:hypothetical protein
MIRKANQFEEEAGLKKITGWKQTQTDEASYSKLRRAVRNEDYTTAKKLLEELRQGRTDKDIIAAMKINAKRPFTGNQRVERMFLQSLTPAELEQYSQAMIQRQEGLMKFIDWYLTQD